MDSGFPGNFMPATADVKALVESLKAPLNGFCKKTIMHLEVLSFKVEGNKFLVRIKADKDNFDVLIVKPNNQSNNGAQILKATSSK